MYPKTHLYFAQKLFQINSSAFVLGCIFPDIAGVAGISRNTSHSMGRRLWQEWQKTQLADFALGVATHGNDPPALDYYGDEKYLNYEKGYCFAKSRLIEKETQALGIPAEMAWWKGHNIVEMAVEIWVSQQGAYGRQIHQALRDEELRKSLVPALSRFLACSEGSLAHGLDIFADFVENGVSKPASMAAIFAKQMQLRHQISLDLKATAALIEQSEALIQKDLADFWQNIEEPVKQAIQAIPDLRKENSGEN